MTKQDAQQRIADVIAEYEKASGLGVTGLELEVDFLYACKIDSKPHESRKLGVVIHANRYGINFGG